MTASPAPTGSYFAEQVLTDQSDRWRRGEHVRVEWYLEQHPGLGDNARLLLELIANEVRLRLEHGEGPTLEDYLGRFPAHAADLRAAWEVMRRASADRTDQMPTHPDPVGSVSRQPLPAVPGYEIVGELGRGGMGVVYQARQTALGRSVALKVVLHGELAGAEALARFRREAQAVARLQHPNIVAIHEVGEHHGLPYFSLEFCEGGTLARRLAAGPLPAEEAAQIVEVLARAVQAAHDAGVIHRDLKPANVLFTRDGVLKVADFGLARVADAAEQTQSGVVVGTPSYMAPEQARGKAREVGPATDVWALGAILYECLTGRPPFKAAAAVDTLFAVVSQAPLSPSKVRPQVPAGLDELCLRCLEKEPARRPASAAEVAAALRAWLDAPRRQPDRPRRPRWLLGLASAAVLAALLVGAAVWKWTRPTDPGGKIKDEKGEGAVEPGARTEGPDLYVVHPPRPPWARVAVRAHQDTLQRIAADSVAIAIVLDYSGSMTRKVRGENVPRWQAATTALRRVLKELPNGTTVSLRGFHSAGENDNAADRRPRIPLLWSKVAWDRDPRAVGQLMDVVEKEPRGGWTPLLRAMELARDDFPRDFQGRRVMLVITDGADSYFHHPADPDADIKGKARTITEFLHNTFRTEAHKDIQIHAIGLDVQRQNLTARAEVSALEEFPLALERVGGRWHNAGQRRELAEEVRRSLLTVWFRVDAADGQAPRHKPLGGWVSSGSGGSLHWVEVPVGDHPERGTIKIPGIENGRQDIQLQRGDHLVLHLLPPSWWAPLPRFHHGLYAGSDLFPSPGSLQRAAPVGEWNLAALAARQTRGGQLHARATIEKALGIARPNRQVRVFQPGWTWFEVYRTGYTRDRPVRLQVFPCAGSPAPTWEIVAPGWPAGTSATLHAWWSSHPPSPCCPGHTVEPHRLLGLRQVPWSNRPPWADIVIEEVCLEKEGRVLLPNAPTGELRATAVADCLTVRLRYPAAKDQSPFFVGLEDSLGRGWSGGEAHSWHHAAGSYTGVFWPATEDRLKELLALQLYSVERLKDASFHRRMELGVPRR